jgi:DNA replicative helicase MCM subunit Mcm2 (Cdc46/Mcm family)
VDQGIDDKRAMVVQSELASTLRVLGRDGNTLSAILRDAWDGKDLRIMNKNSPVGSTQPHISIIGHITKSELTRYLTATESDNGFANRFLWVCVKRSKLLPEGGKLGNANEFDVIFKPLIEKLQRAVEFARGVIEIQRDDDALTLWREIYPKLSEGKPGLFGAVTARAEAQTMRLSSLYAFLDLSPVIRIEHLQAAIALWSYCEQSARFIFGNSIGDPIANTIKQALDETPKGMTRSEISSTLFKRNVQANRIDDALNKLFASGFAHKEKEEVKSGRPSERWFSMKYQRINSYISFNS